MKKLMSNEKWPNVTENCVFCRSRYYVPSHQDFPVPLRNLSRAVIYALRPFHLYIGDHEQGRAGFRRHARLCEIRCSPEDVTIKLNGLPHEERRVGLIAFDYLMNGCPSSAYSEFVREHRDAILNNKQHEFLSSGFLLKKFLECALWPHLYPTRNSCDTSCAGSTSKYKSVKMAFLAKVCSPVQDYAVNFELLHFHYDRHVLSHFTGVGRSSNIELHRALKNFPDSPHDLLLNARALEDLNMQFGAAKFMITMAPGAYATTWHELCLNVKDVTGVRTLGDNALEALHIVNVLDQICRGLLFNSSYKGHRSRSPWTIFDTNHRETCVQAWAYRLEFQEGTRKEFPGAPSKHYHGTGMPHVHCVFWGTERIRDSNLLRWLRADMAEDFPRLHAAVLRLQMLHTPERTYLPISEETRWDGSTPVLRHQQQDEDRGILPYLAPLCLTGLCHSNVSYISNAGQVAEYMTKLARYVTKTNDALSPGWLRKEKIGFRAAVHFLMSTKPSAAQMLNLLSSGSTFFLSCPRKEVSVPAPDDDEGTAATELFRHYVQDNASQTFTFQEYLRSFNTSVTPPRRYKCVRGNTVALACETTSPWRDHFYAQWLTLNHVWKGSVQFPGERTRAPPQHLWFATCLLMEPEFWNSDDRIVYWLSMAAMSKPRMLTLLAAIKCWRRYVSRFLSGSVIYCEPQLARENVTVLTDEQTEAFQTICAAYGAMCHSQTSVAVRLRGEAGTGKSRVLNEICWMSTLPEGSEQRHHMFTAKNVLLVTPTGVLSDAYRRCWLAADNIEVDTFDGAFDSLKKCVDIPYQLSQFDVWIVDECDFLSATQWLRLRELYDLCAPMCLMMAGDPSQLTPAGGVTGGILPLEAQNIVLRQQLRYDPRSPWGKAVQALRNRKPTDRELDTLVGGRVLCAADVTVEGVSTFHELYPQGLSVAITIRGAQLLNDLAVQALLTDDLFRGDIVVDTKDSTRRIPVHVTSRLMITRNLNKDRGVVNGAFGHVVHFERDIVVLRLDSGVEAAVHKVAYENEDGSYYVAYPLELGYACTLAKVQGSTLDRGLAIYPDVGVPGGGYVAVTRVKNPEKLMWYVTPSKRFFVPSRQ